MNEAQRERKKAYMRGYNLQRRQTTKKYRLANKEKIQKQKRIYEQEHKEERRAYRRKYVPVYYSAHKERLNSYVRAYRALPANRIKEKARNAARERIPMLECLKCGSKELLQRHHEDYSKPLEVVVLCHVCHREIHEQKKKNGGN